MGIALAGLIGADSICRANDEPSAKEESPAPEKKESERSGHSNESGGAAGEAGQRSQGAREDSTLPAGSRSTQGEKEDSAVPAGSRSSQGARPSGHLKTVEMKISGSMCLACLHELEKRLKELPGLSKAKIEYPGDNYYNAYLQTVAASFARATISYDPGLVDLDNIKAMLRSQGYFAFKVIDKRK
jgi:copper chaperone CopZ